MAWWLNMVHLGLVQLYGQGQDFTPKTQATWLLFVYALLTLTVSHGTLPLLV